NWINFSKEIVTYILEYLKIHPEYLSKFEHTLCGDEIFFHTLILNSPYASKVVNDSKRYIEYDSGGPENPRTLKMKDLYKIESSNAWFGRKFNDKVDNEVINVIYSKIESKN
ncbi:MAG: hypothetical protein LBH12_02745, partial [Dysgonamonadaceae bacterium]|nr:hypothetical protein [Dysgonamonadaceae bacterium]